MESFGIGLHEAIFDAVVDHLHKASCTASATMQIAKLDAGIAAFTAGGSRDVAGARSQGCKDRVEMLDPLLVAADHQTVSAIEAPNAATGAAIDVANALGLQGF